ncbi:MAG: gluconate 2-dehydrogenase subunit 3 family protein [Alphaproteobacteria bacterium]|nr:gluconate 2-dehydrogenase subunit 3 family protein [Alphaproteobacteria bacterium]
MTHTIVDRRRDEAPPIRTSDKAHLLLDRRALLKTAFSAIGAYAVTVSGVTWLVGPRRAWAMEFEAFDADTADTLLHMTRALYPHEKVGDAHYAEVVKSLDAAVAGADDPEAGLAVYADGVKRLNEAAGGSFADLDDDAKEAALEAEAASEDPGFFQAVRGQVVNVLYNNHEVWKIFGYQGASYEEGGYLFRGFDDLSWLPDPPDEASPPAQDE